MSPDDPDDTDRLNGCSIVDAFRQFVLAHQSVVDARRRLRDTDTNRAIFEEGQFPGPIVTFCWPVMLSADDLAEAFVSRIAFFLEDPVPRASPEQQEAARALADRWETLIKRLQDGVLVASGTYHQTGAMSEIDKLMWCQKNVAVDMQNGDLIEYSDNKAVVMWRGLSLSLGAAHGRNGVSRTQYSTSRSQGEPASNSKKASIESAVNALWPDGIPNELPKKVRNGQIVEWLRENNLPEVNDRTIRRFLQSTGQ